MGCLKCRLTLLLLCGLLMPGKLLVAEVTKSSGDDSATTNSSAPDDDSSPKNNGSESAPQELGSASAPQELGSASAPPADVTTGEGDSGASNETANSADSPPDAVIVTSPPPPESAPTPDAHPPNANVKPGDTAQKKSSAVSSIVVVFVGILLAHAN
ncbi:hypothetical protein Q1695_007301 [Nippostrongylus brasiliensis]|nr:hypothetical protein Q1695_007301 [Nippostrongylus brasiliensis]